MTTNTRTRKRKSADKSTYDTNNNNNNVVNDFDSNSLVSAHLFQRLLVLFWREQGFFLFFLLAQMKAKLDAWLAEFDLEGSLLATIERRKKTVCCIVFVRLCAFLC